MPFDPDSVRRWLDDIHYHILLAQTFAEGMSYAAFRGDLRTIYAVTRSLEIISEASRRLPDELKVRHPSIQWRDMAAAGNIYRHEDQDVALMVTFSRHVSVTPGPRGLAGAPMPRERSAKLATMVDDRSMPTAPFLRPRFLVRASQR